MKIALIGYGKMGKTIHALMQRAGMPEPFILHRDRPTDWETQLQSCQVAIEFTSPDEVLRNLETCFRLGVPVVTGSTGWNKHLESVKNACTAQHGALFYASNFSLGLQLFLRLNRSMAQLMQHYPEYRLSMEEVHHVHKADAPSGTAITIAETLLKERNDYQGWQLQPGAAEGQIGIEALRIGDTFGTHSVFYRSTHDEITLSHKAFGREGFASGALAAARFLAGKQGVFTMDDLLSH